jgi:hypothetical protein
MSLKGGVLLRGLELEWIYSLNENLYSIGMKIYTPSVSKYKRKIVNQN